MNFCTLRVWVKEAGQKRGRVVFDFFLSRHCGDTEWPDGPLRTHPTFVALASEYPAGTLFRIKEKRH